ncbi:MAG: glutamyl-tRNA amidotransferase [Hyphomicrobium sp.]|nr:MAG: glutamyl-tRNA amidotransferase [Hyphomicrobium sp.]
MRDRILQSVKDAMKSGNKPRLATLRLVTAAIKDRDLALPAGSVPDTVGESEILSLLQKMVKQRRESITLYKDANRQDLVDQEAFEIAIIEEFLPRQMSDGDLRKAITGVIGELGLSGLKDMGKAMGALKERFTGQMDFAKANGVVKELLK